MAIIVIITSYLLAYFQENFNFNLYWNFKLKSKAKLGSEKMNFFVSGF